MFLFNSKESEHAPVRLGDVEVELVNSIVYLGLPFGSSITETLWLLMVHFHKRVSYIYSRIIANKQKFEHQIQSRLDSAMVLPHLLYLSPCWRIFTLSDRRNLRATYYRFAKFLLRVPPWTSNRYMSRRFNIITQRML